MLIKHNDDGYTHRMSIDAEGKRSVYIPANIGIHDGHLWRLSSHP